MFDAGEDVVVSGCSFDQIDVILRRILLIAIREGECDEAAGCIGMSEDVLESTTMMMLAVAVSEKSTEVARK